MKTINCIIMLLGMCMTINAQSLKTYSGAYRANAHLLLGTQKATYTYKNAEDGTRIYEGSFAYSCTSRPNLYTKVSGHFHDDCKEGLWTYTDKSSETKTLKINFKEGYRNGIYEYTYTTSKGTIKESLKATMKMVLWSVLFPDVPFSMTMIMVDLVSLWGKVYSVDKLTRMDLQMEHGN